MGPGQDVVMPRQMRIEYAGAIYQIVSRGDRREPIFPDESRKPNESRQMDKAMAGPRDLII